MGKQKNSIDYAKMALEVVDVICMQEDPQATNPTLRRIYKIVHAAYANSYKDGCKNKHADWLNELTASYEVLKKNGYI